MPSTDTDATAPRAAYSIPEAAQRLSVSTSSLYRLIDRGEIRRVKIGHRSVIPATEIDRVLTLDAGPEG